MKISNLPTVLTLLTTLFFIAYPVVADEHWSDDWEIKVDGKSESTGSLNFTVAYEPAEDGTVKDPVSIEALIPEKSSANDVAEIITNTFRATLGDEDFDIDRKWGENVHIDAKHKRPDFGLTLDGSTVQGISVRIES